jgi:hypothetical protein
MVRFTFKLVNLMLSLNANKHSFMYNERSRNVLNETIKEHNKASESLSDFANVEHNARNRRK